MRPFPPESGDRIALPKFPGPEGLGSVSVAGPELRLDPPRDASDTGYRPMFAVTVACWDPVWGDCAPYKHGAAYNRCFSRYALWLTRLTEVTGPGTGTPPAIEVQVRGASFAAATVLFTGTVAPPTYGGESVDLIVAQSTVVLYQQWELWARLPVGAPVVDLRCSVDLDRQGNFNDTSLGEFTTAVP